MFNIIGCVFRITIVFEYEKELQENYGFDQENEEGQEEEESTVPHLPFLVLISKQVCMTLSMKKALIEKWLRD